MTKTDFTPRIAFSGAKLDHAEDKRDLKTLEAHLKDPKARAVLLVDGKPAIDASGQLTMPHPSALKGKNIVAPGPVFLGKDAQGPVFAFSVVEGQTVGEDVQFMEMRAIAARMDPASLALAGRAKSLFDWHTSHRFCSTCGKESQSSAGGLFRRCPSCESDHFPRVNPVAIMLILHENACLLGRTKGWPDGAYSALAGFVSPGESMEEACIREVKEEVGLDVSDVEYVFSQPWPFPSQLMLGLVCRAKTRDISVNLAELENARWFSKDTVKGVFAKTDNSFLHPPGFTIANQLLRYWIAE